MKKSIVFIGDQTSLPRGGIFKDFKDTYPYLIKERLINFFDFQIKIRHGNDSYWIFENNFIYDDILLYEPEFVIINFGFVNINWKELTFHEKSFPQNPLNLMFEYFFRIMRCELYYLRNKGDLVKQRYRKLINLCLKNDIKIIIITPLRLKMQPENQKYNNFKKFLLDFEPNPNIVVIDIDKYNVGKRFVKHKGGYYFSNEMHEILSKEIIKILDR